MTNENRRTPIAANVLVEIEQERFLQNQQWGGAAHDDEHAFMDWLAYITRQLQRAPTITSQREILIKIAALAVAGLESATRKSTIRGSLADYVAEQRKQRPDIKICLIAHTLAWATKLAREAGIKDGPDGIVCGPLGSLIGARVDLLILDQSFDKHLGEAWYQENVLGRLTEGAQIVRYAGPGET